MAQERNATLLLDRPLSPRSLVGSLLLGMRAPRMPASRLVEWCGLFGVAEGTARVALSRMVDRGELTASEGVYELAGSLRGRQIPQDWSLAPQLRPWTGEWVLGLVSTGPRGPGERAALREAGRRLRMVELREGVWGRPDNLPRAAAPADAWETADAQCNWWSGRPGAGSVELATELFDTAGWASRARELHGHLVGATAGVRTGGGAAIADAFLVGAATLTHVRADPLLPDELCGAGWPGRALRDAYREYQATFSGSLRDWFRKR